MSAPTITFWLFQASTFDGPDVELCVEADDENDALEKAWVQLARRPGHQIDRGSIHIEKANPDEAWERGLIKYRQYERWLNTQPEVEL